MKKINKSFMSWMRATFFGLTKTEICSGLWKNKKEQQQQQHRWQQRHTTISIASSVILRLIVFDVRSPPNEITIGSNLLSHHICIDGYRILMCVNLDSAIKMCNGFRWCFSVPHKIVRVAGSQSFARKLVLLYTFTHAFFDRFLLLLLVYWPYTHKLLLDKSNF